MQLVLKVEIWTWLGSLKGDVRGECWYHWWVSDGRVMCNWTGITCFASEVKHVWWED